MLTNQEDTAILLRRVDYGDVDVIVDLMLQHHGRISAFARGARKSQRRFSGGLGPFTLLRVKWKPSRSDGLAQLHEAEGIAFLADVVANPLRLAAASWLVSLVEAITQPTMGADPFFSYIWKILQWINDVETPEQLACGMLRAEIVLLQDAGILGTMDGCERSGQALSQMERVVLLPGIGLVAQTHVAHDEHGVTLNKESVRILDHVMHRRVMTPLLGDAYHPIRVALKQNWALVLDRLPHTWSTWDKEIRLKIPEKKPDS